MSTTIESIERRMIGAAMCGQDEALESLIAERAELIASGATS